MTADVVAEVRKCCLALPEATERLSHGTPSFFVGRQFATVWPIGHHDASFPQLWCAASYGVQAELIAMAPKRFFKPAYVGPRGWIGVRLDGAVDWAEVANLCEDAYRVVAPARLVRQLDADTDA